MIFTKSFIDKIEEAVKDISEADGKLEVTTLKVSEKMIESDSSEELKGIHLKRLCLLVQTAISTGCSSRVSIRKGRGGGLFFKDSVKVKKLSREERKRMLAEGRVPPLNETILNRVETSLKEAKKKLEDAKAELKEKL